MMAETQELLAEYANTRSEAAFRELTVRYVDLVYSTALRLVDGDTHRAEDISQQVFIRLSQNAGKLAKTWWLGGWLHRCACNAAAQSLRAERRRAAREREAALMESNETCFDEITPILDKAINDLGEQDRAAIVLRFYEQKDYRAIAGLMGSSEDAARMRVNRALDKLRTLLKRRGVAVAVPALSGMLAAQAVCAAPASLAAVIATQALAAPATSSLAVFLTMKTNTAIVGALILAGLVVPLTFQSRAISDLRDQNLALQNDLNQIERAPSANSFPLAPARQPDIPEAQLEELLRLRGESGMQRDELARLRAKAAAQQAAAAKLEKAAKSYYPKESWAAASRDTPESAVAADMGFLSDAHDLQTLRAKITNPAALAQLDEALKTRTEEEINAEFAREAEQNAKRDGIRAINTETVTNDPNHVIVTFLIYSNHGTNDLWGRMEEFRKGDQWSRMNQ